VNKFQKLNFSSIDDFLEYLPGEEVLIVHFLQKLIRESLPDCKVKLSYNVPFYSRHRRICFIWPSAIPWGGIETGVALGFCRANEMILEDDFLSFGKKKVVATATFQSVQEIPIEKLRQLLFEASIVDDKFAKSKNPQRMFN